MKVESNKSVRNQELLPENNDDDSLLDALNVNEHITFQGDNEESDVKCASVDALVVYATYSKSKSFTYYSRCLVFNIEKMLIGQLMFVT